jgi:hypothetical protein
MIQTGGIKLGRQHKKYLGQQFTNFSVQKSGKELSASDSHL